MARVFFLDFQMVQILICVIEYITAECHSITRPLLCFGKDLSRSGKVIPLEHANLSLRNIVLCFPDLLKSLSKHKRAITKIRTRTIWDQGNIKLAPFSNGDPCPKLNLRSEVSSGPDILRHSNLTIPKVFMLLKASGIRKILGVVLVRSL
jgi:hypothetical protein